MNLVWILLERYKMTTVFYSQYWNLRRKGALSDLSNHQRALSSNELVLRHERVPSAFLQKYLKWSPLHSVKLEWKQSTAKAEAEVRKVSYGLTIIFIVLWKRGCGHSRYKQRIIYPFKIHAMASPNSVQGWDNNIFNGTITFVFEKNTELWFRVDNMHLVCVVHDRNISANLSVSKLVSQTVQHIYRINMETRI